MVLSFASSERSTRPREGLSGAVKHPPNGSILSWRGLIRPGGLCFFHVEFWPVAPLRDGSGSIVQIWLLRDRQLARSLLNWRKQLCVNCRGRLRGTALGASCYRFDNAFFGVRGA